MSSNYKVDPVRDPAYKGQRTNKKLKEGPVESRGCTDCLCLVLFAGFWAGMIMVAGYGFAFGKPEYLVAPYDSQGNPCGLDNNTDFPFLYWVPNANGLLNPTSTICIDGCPSMEDSDATNTFNCAPDTKQECDDIMMYDSEPLGGRICMPVNNQTLIQNLNQSQAYVLTFGRQAVADIQTSWWVIFIVAGVALVFGFLYLFLMRFCSGVVTWGLIVFYFLGLIGFGFLCWEEATNANFNQAGPSAFTNVDPTILEFFAYTCWAIAGISLLAFCFLFKKIELAIAVLKCASEFIEGVPSTLLIPPFFFFISVIFYLYWIFSSIYILGTGEITPSPDQLPFASAQFSDKSILLFIYYIFALLWNHAFLAALPQFVIASACCIWYFSAAENKKPKSPVSKSICRGLFFHLGSIAFGSFLVALVDSIRVTINYFEAHMRNARDGQADNCCAKYCLACSNCCLDCFERFLRFINRHAYIQIAMTGESFCKAAQEAFYLALRNAGRFGIVHGIGGLFVFIGQLFITFVGTITGYWIFVSFEYFQQGLFSPVAPTILCAMVSLIIAHIFMSVYGVSADAIIHCYCMDEEIHETGPRMAPKSLKEFVNKHVPQKLMST